MKISPQIDSKILEAIRTNLNPDKKIVLSKLFGIHILTSILTLSICSQFGFQFFNTSLNLMHHFMKFGQNFCDFACGSFFTIVTCYIATMIISRDELRVLKYNKLLAISSVILVSIGFFAIMSPQIFLELTLLWILGATLAAILALEIGIRLQLTTLN